MSLFPNVKLLLVLAGAVFVAGGCQLDVSYDIDHELRAIELDRTTRTLALRYDIQELRVWRQWPCFAHGCGDSRRLPSQLFDLTWALPAQATTAPVPVTGFRPHVREASRSSRNDVASALAVGENSVQFTADDRLGRFPVLKHDRTLCWRALPCFVRTPDGRHMLVAAEIYSMDTGQPVIDLSTDVAFAEFVESAVERFSYVRGELPGRHPSIGYALSNDLQFVVAHPALAGCLRSRDAQQRFNALVVFDLQTRTFTTHVLPAAGDDRQPIRNVHHVYFRGRAVHFAAQYADWFESEQERSCRDAEAVFDFDSASGSSRALDAAAYLIGSGTSIDGAANFHTRFDFEDGVIELVVFDIPDNEKRTYRLALPREILEQVTHDKVRPGIADGEFIRN